ncbi:MAG: hypothetical protein IPK97_10410 [Ahniella sp.]|nr:hypothetical protein [Ahniella sp.]
MCHKRCTITRTAFGSLSWWSTGFQSYWTLFTLAALLVAAAFWVCGTPV